MGPVSRRRHYARPFRPRPPRVERCLPVTSGGRAAAARAARATMPHRADALRRNSRSNGVRRFRCIRPATFSGRRRSASSSGEVWVVSGDYKLAPDPTCAPFEACRCHTFVTESTFGLPIFRWRRRPRVLRTRSTPGGAPTRRAGKASVLFAYPLGKAQRVLAGLDACHRPDPLPRRRRALQPHLSRAGVIASRRRLYTGQCATGLRLEPAP